MIRNTRQSLAIVTTLRDAGRPLSPEEILEHARAEVPSLSLATVYRQLKRLTADDSVARVDLPGESPRFEHRQAARRHHHHFRCESCDRVFDLEGCPPGIADLVPDDFELQRHELVLYGRCSACAPNP